MPDPAFRPGSDAEWDDLLRRLRQQSAVSPPPFFYGRVHARLLAKARAPFVVLPPWLRRPVYATLLGVLILAVSGDGVAAARHHPVASPPAGPFSR